MAKIEDSFFDSGFHAGDINVDNDKFIATSGGVIANEGSEATVANGPGSVAHSGDGDLIQAKNSAVLTGGEGGNDIGAFSFGSGSATNVEDSALFGSAVGNSGPVQQIQGNTLGDGAALGGRDALADNDTSLSFSNEENNLTNIENSSQVSTAQDDSTVESDQVSFDVEDSFKSFTDNKQLSDDDIVVSKSEDLDLDL